MTGVRYREDTGFEGLCQSCRQHWPLTREFWMIRQGLRRCRACWAEGRKPVVLRRRYRKLTPEQRAAHRIYNREWMRRDRAERRAVMQRRAA